MDRFKLTIRKPRSLKVFIGMELVNSVSFGREGSSLFVGRIVDNDAHIDLTSLRMLENFESSGWDLVD
jgi:hypothetical protein